MSAEFKVNKSVAFNPPKMMICWLDGDDMRYILPVAAIIPCERNGVIAYGNETPRELYMFDHCAIVPPQHDRASKGPLRASNREIAAWIEAGNFARVGKRLLTRYVYSAPDWDKPCIPYLTIRRKGAEEDSPWLEPTKENVQL